MRTEALGARPQRQSVPVGGWAIGCWVSGEGWDGREVGLTDGWGEGWREIKARRRRRVEGREGREIRRGGMTRDFGGALFRVGRGGGETAAERRERGRKERGRESERGREGWLRESLGLVSRGAQLRTWVRTRSWSQKWPCLGTRASEADASSSAHWAQGTGRWRWYWRRYGQGGGGMAGTRCTAH